MTIETSQTVVRKASRLGETLRRERQGRNISIRQVSEATKINARHLEALEQSDFASLPGGAFSKGFVRAYAAHLGLDAEAMVNRYQHEIARLTTAPEEPAPPTRDERRRRFLRVAVIAGSIAFVLAAGAAAVWFLPRWRW